MIGIHKGGKRNIKFGILLNSVMKTFNAQKNKTPNFLNHSNQEFWILKKYEDIPKPNSLDNEDFWNKAIKPPLDGKSRKENCKAILLKGRTGEGKIIRKFRK